MKNILLKNKLAISFIIISILLVFIFNFKVYKGKTKNHINVENMEENFKGLNMNKSKVCIKYENRDLRLKLPIYIDCNRYYIPVSEIIDKCNGKFSIKADEVYLNLGDKKCVLNVKDGNYVYDKKTKSLKGKIIIQENVLYMSLFDFEKALDLKSYWNIEYNSINFYKNRHKINFSNNFVSNNKPALIRLEDITAGGTYESMESLDKLRIIADYLYSENVPFHVAWVPRYINPSRNKDNDPSNLNSMYNANFVFTLDYFIDRNGIIGLHGYTHQYDKSESVDGIEFHRGKSDKVPETFEYAEGRLGEALRCSEKLNIKCDFFEAPHYAILPVQMRAVEKKFKYVYQPYSENGGINESKSIVAIENGGRKSIYIPTPLNYVDGKKDCERMLKNIDVLNEKTLASFFYHPYIEFNDISLFRDSDGYPNFHYSNTSVLHRILNSMKNKDFKFCKIHEIE